MKKIFGFMAGMAMAGMINPAMADDRVNVEYLGLMNEHEFFEGSSRGNDQYDPKSRKIFAVGFRLSLDDQTVERAVVCDALRLYGKGHALAQIYNSFAFMENKTGTIANQSTVTEMATKAVDAAFLDCSPSS
jgi:hypothetical protein